MKSFERLSPNLQEAVTTAASLEGGVLEETLVESSTTSKKQNRRPMEINTEWTPASAAPVAPVATIESTATSSSDTTNPILSKNVVTDATPSCSETISTSHYSTSASHLSNTSTIGSNSTNKAKSNQHVDTSALVSPLSSTSVATDEFLDAMQEEHESPQMEQQDQHQQQEAQVTTPLSLEEGNQGGGNFYHPNNEKR